MTRYNGIPPRLAPPAQQRSKVAAPAAAVDVGVQEINDALVGAKREVEQLKERIRELRDELTAVKESARCCKAREGAEQDELKAQLRHLKTEHTFLAARYEEVKSREEAVISTRNQQHEKLRDEIYQLKDHLQGKELECGRAKRTNESLQEQLAMVRELEEELIIAVKGVEDLANADAEHRKQVQLFQAKIQAAITNADCHIDEIDRLQCQLKDSRSKEQQLSSLVTELQAQLLAANRLVTLNGVRRDVESTAKAQLAGHAEGVDHTALCNLLSDCENSLTDALAASETPCQEGRNVSGDPRQQQIACRALEVVTLRLQMSNVPTEAVGGRSCDMQEVTSPVQGAILSIFRKLGLIMSKVNQELMILQSKESCPVGKLNKRASSALTHGTVGENTNREHIIEEEPKNVMKRKHVHEEMNIESDELKVNIPTEGARGEAYSRPIDQGTHGGFATKKIRSFEHTSSMHAAHQEADYVKTQDDVRADTVTAPSGRIGSQDSSIVGSDSQELHSSAVMKAVQCEQDHKEVLKNSNLEDTIGDLFSSLGNSHI